VPAKSGAVPNGVVVSETLDCNAGKHEFAIGPSFDMTKSWTLTFDFISANADQPLSKIVYIGKDQSRALIVQQNLANLQVRWGDPKTPQGVVMGAEFNPASSGKWLPVVVRYDAGANKLSLFFDGLPAETKTAKGAAQPLDDPVLFVGGRGNDTSSIDGQVRNVRFVNEEQFTPP
jgi:hypothetical protein